MAYTNRASFAPVLEKTGASILDAYSAFSSATTQVGDVLLIQNFTDIPVMLSFYSDLSDNLPIASNGFFLLDLNKYINEENTSLPKGTIISARRLNAGTPATTGSVWITIMYSRAR